MIHLNLITVRRKVTFIFSLCIMAIGIYGLGQQIHEIINILPVLTQESINIQLTSQVYQYLLKYTLVTSVVNFVTTAYGLALLIKPSHLVKTAHFIVGVLIVAINFYLSYVLGISASNTALILTVG